MGRRAVEIKIVFLDILTVVPLAIGQTEGSLFQDRILTIPECEGKAEMLLLIGNACQTIFSPLVYPCARLVVSKIIPGVAVLTVVLAYRTPLPFAEVRYPLLAGCLAFSRFLQTDRFVVH